MWLLRCGVVVVLWVSVQCSAVQCSAVPGEGRRRPRGGAVPGEGRRRPRGGAVPGEGPADPADLNVTVCDTLDLLWTVVGQTVKSAVEPSIATLDSRLESRLDSVQTQLESGLESVQTRLESQLESVQTRLTGVQTQLESRLDSVRAELLLPAASPPRDCSDLPAGATSGVHLLQPGLRQPVPAYCDLETDGGGWTVIQRRADVQPRQDFYLGWEEYKWGLGELDAEFWWGNEHLWLTTSLLDRRYQLRIDMEDFDGAKRYALYQGFRLSSEADGYRLTVANYSGDAGDNFGSLSGIRFSTKDRDQDTYSGNCAQMYKGGWWYTACHSSNLNGLYLSGQHSSHADGVNWHAWRGHHYSLKTVEMKIRPSKKL